MDAVSAVFHKQYPASAPSVPIARHDVIDALAAADFSDPKLQARVAIALTEATGNVVRHAYPNGQNEVMEVAVTKTPGGIAITITDHGVGMNGRIGLPGMGLGLSMMRSQSTSAEIHSDTSGTVVTLHFEDR